MIYNIDAETANKIISESPTFAQLTLNMAMDPLIHWKLKIQNLFPKYYEGMAGGQKIEAIRWIIENTKGKEAVLLEFQMAGFDVYPFIPKLSLVGAKRFVESF